MKEENYQKNIGEFMKKYGIDGFLRLYFTNFLFKAIKFQMRSKLEGSDLNKDPGVVYYIHNNKIGKIEEIEKFEKELKEICSKAAKTLVKELEKNEKLKDLFEGNLDKIDDEKVQKELEKSFHDLLNHLSDKNE